MSSQVFLSIVIPVFNEAESIEQLHSEVVDVCNQGGFTFEVIIVNDSSKVKPNHDLSCRQGSARVSSTAIVD